MNFRVVFYCPDRHITYDGRTPEELGVGGGISARIRMAEALQRAGNDVTMVVNCETQVVVRNVLYVPLDEMDSLDADVLILNTSGDQLDLSPAMAMPMKAKIRAVWLHGSIHPGGLESLSPDIVYAVSNFIRDVAVDGWGVPAERLFVIYNSFDSRLYSELEAEKIDRDPYRLIYFSHPSKGLDPTLSLLRALREDNPHYHLRVFGGYALWGDTREVNVRADGVDNRGLVGQSELIREIRQSTYSIHLQTLAESGSLAIFEAMRGGCVLLASPVGCFPEYISHKRTGFLIEGDPNASSVIRCTADVIKGLTKNPEALSRIRIESQAIVWGSDIMAMVWMRHWRWWLEGKPTPSTRCTVCEGAGLVLEDGFHCCNCGMYQERSNRQFILERNGI